MLIGSLKLLFSGDTRGVQEATDQVGKQLTHLTKQVHALKKSQGDALSGGSANGLLGKMAGIGGAVLAAKAGFDALQGSIAFIGDAIAKADDLDDTLGAISHTLGGGADSVVSRIDMMARSFGLARAESATAAQEIAAALTAIGGKSGEEAGKITSDLLQGIADLSVGSKKSFAEIGDALAAALRGKTKGLESLGVALDEDTIKAEAFRMGIMRGGDELSRAEKQAAILSLVMEKMSDVQGNAEADSHDAAAAIGKLTEAWDNFGRVLGREVGPAAQMVIEHLTGTVELVEKLVQGLSHFDAGAIFRGGNPFAGGSADASAPAVSAASKAQAAASATAALNEAMEEQAAAAKAAKEDTKNFAKVMERGESMARDIWTQMAAPNGHAAGRGLFDLVQEGMPLSHAMMLAQGQDRLDEMNRSRQFADDQAAAMREANRMRPEFAQAGTREFYMQEMRARTGLVNDPQERVAKNTERAADTLQKLLDVFANASGPAVAF